jgi:hypothetical protein
LAFTLLQVYHAEEQHKAMRNQRPPLPLPERKMAADASPSFTLLPPSKMMATVYTHSDIWAHPQDFVLYARKRLGATLKADDVRT